MKILAMITLFFLPSLAWAQPRIEGPGDFPVYFEYLITELNTKSVADFFMSQNLRIKKEIDEVYYAKDFTGKGIYRNENFVGVNGKFRPDLMPLEAEVFSILKFFDEDDSRRLYTLGFKQKDFQTIKKFTNKPFIVDDPNIRSRLKDTQNNFLLAPTKAQLMDISDLEILAYLKRHHEVTLESNLDSAIETFESISIVSQRALIAMAWERAQSASINHRYQFAISTAESFRSTRLNFIEKGLFKEHKRINQ